MSFKDDIGYYSYGEMDEYNDVVCVTKDGQKIRLSKIGDNHLINRIKYFKRMLENRPSEAVYMGDSVYAEDAVEAENNRNEILAEDVTKHIRLMEKEAKERKLKF